MRVNGGSDFARLQALQKHAFATRNRLDVAAQEMTSNLKADRFEATGGNLTRLFALERSLDRNAVFSQTISLTELRLDVMQESLGQILTPAEDLAIDLADAVGRGRLRRVDAARDRGAARLRRHGRRSSTPRSPASRSSPAPTTDGPALAQADAILADLDALAGGAATAADAIAAIDAYFAKPGRRLLRRRLRRLDRPT